MQRDVDWIEIKTRDGIVAQKKGKLVGQFIQRLQSKEVIKGATPNTSFRLRQQQLQPGYAVP